MIYCKIVQNGKVTDVGYSFMRWVAKNHVMAYCDIQKAEFVQSAFDESRLYRAYWFQKPDESASGYSEAEVFVIEASEYDELYALLNDGETVEVPEEPVLDQLPEPNSESEEPEEPEEQPMTVQQMRNKIAELEATIARILEKM